MKLWKASSLGILLFGSHLLVTADSSAQTVQAPRPGVRDTRPTVQPAPDKLKSAVKNLETLRVEEAVTCEDLVADMKKGFENLKRACSDPARFGWESMTLSALRKQWAEKKCDQRAIDPKPKQDVRYLFWIGIQSVRGQCVEACFDEVADSVKSRRLEEARVWCRECCSFSSTNDRQVCLDGCGKLERQLYAALYESGNEKTREYLDMLAPILRTIEDITKAVTRSFP